MLVSHAMVITYTRDTCEKIRIDYAVMERPKEIYNLPVEFSWSDLGSWGSLCALLPQDEAGNAKVGKDIRLYFIPTNIDRFALLT